jgi:hypothetical protein
MSWWGREASPAEPPAIAESGPLGITPVLVPGDRATVAAELLARAPGFARPWRPRPGDAGLILAQLFGEQAEPVLARLNRMPEKIFVEFLRIAGVAPIPATPATVLVELTVDPSSPEPVLVARGCQLSAHLPSGDLVFETDDDLVAAPGTVGALLDERNGLYAPAVPDDFGRIAPFGDEADAGSAFWIGLTGDVAPGPSLSLTFSRWSSPDAPPPAIAGALAPLVAAAGPRLTWQIVDGERRVALSLLRDGTADLSHSGVVTLAVPASFAPSAAPDGSGLTLRWIRVEITSGAFDSAPLLTRVGMNGVTATAGKTFRGERLVVIGDSRAGRFQLSQTPVVPGSLQLAVDEGAGSDTQPLLVPWHPVAALGEAGPDDRVYTLDEASGVVSFGDGVHGLAVPGGYRNVIAVSYRSGGGAADAVGAAKVTTLVTATPFVTRVSNPDPASGGDDAESLDETVRRGPEEVRARGRAVTVADFERMARHTPLADVRRAHAAPGLHPSFPGRATPGVVGLLVVPAERSDGPPLPDSATLRAVADYLSGTVGPAGVTVVAGPPRYHLVRVEARLVFAATVDVAATVAAVMVAVNRYLDPLTGGEGGDGWPFGGALSYSALLRHVAAVAGVAAVSRLALVVDGERLDRCADYPTPPHDLLFPTTHQILPEGA